jgi:hypothetical protein
MDETGADGLDELLELAEPVIFPLKVVEDCEKGLQPVAPINNTISNCDNKVFLPNIISGDS